MIYIAYISADRQNALVLTKDTKPTSEQLVTLTASVIDKTTFQGVPDQSVYWAPNLGTVNADVFKFFDANGNPWPDMTVPTQTDENGRTSIWVGATASCIGSITAALSLEELGKVSQGAVGGPQQTLAIITYPPEGYEGYPPAQVPVSAEDGLFHLPDYMQDDSTSEYISVLLATKIAKGTPYAIWLGSAPGTLGQLLAPPNTYQGQTIPIKLPYAAVQTGPNKTNSLGYVTYSGRYPRFGPPVNFGATGGPAVLRPDDDNFPPFHPLKAPRVWLPSNNTPEITTPDMLTQGDFDTKGRLTFAILDYNNPDDPNYPVTRYATDQIYLYAYLDAWDSLGDPHTLKYKVNECPILGSDFNGATPEDPPKPYVTTFLREPDCEDFYPDADTDQYGSIWLQYVINNQHYSHSFTTLINFSWGGAGGSRSRQPKKRR